MLWAILVILVIVALALFIFRRKRLFRESRQNGLCHGVFRRKTVLTLLGVVAVAAAVVFTPSVSNAASNPCLGAVSPCAVLRLHLDATQPSYEIIEVRIFKANNPDHEVRYDQASDYFPDLLYGLPPGDYKISPADQRWYGGKSFASAKVVTLKDGTPSALTVLSRGSGTLKGDVDNLNGVGVPFVRVAMHDETDPTEVVARIDSDVAGQVLGSIGPAFKAHALDPTGRYHPQWAQGKSNFKTASGPWTWDEYIRVFRIDPEIRNPSITGPSSISGTIFGPNLVTNSDIVYLYPADDDTNWIERGEVYVPNDSPPGQGHYQIKDIPAGRYKLRFGDALWNGGTTFETATVVATTSGSDTTVDLTVPAHGDVAGRVVSTRGTPVSHLLVTAYDGDSSTPLAYATTNYSPNEQLSGGFLFEDLPLTGIQIRVTDAENRYLQRWYGGNSSRSTATAVTPVNAQSTNVKLTVSDGLVALTAPVITGKRSHGYTLEAQSGKWSLSGASYTRRWYRNGRPISGATGRTYKLNSYDIGKVISYGMVAHKSGYPSARALSRDTSPIR